MAVDVELFRWDCDQKYAFAFVWWASGRQRERDGENDVFKKKSANDMTKYRERKRDSHFDPDAERNSGLPGVIRRRTLCGYIFIFRQRIFVRAEAILTPEMWNYNKSNQNTLRVCVRETVRVEWQRMKPIVATCDDTWINHKHIWARNEWMASLSQYCRSPFAFVIYSKYSMRDRAQCVRVYNVHCSVCDVRVICPIRFAHRLFAGNEIICISVHESFLFLLCNFESMSMPFRRKTAINKWNTGSDDEAVACVLKYPEIGAITVDGSGNRNTNHGGANRHANVRRWWINSRNSIKNWQKCPRFCAGNWNAQQNAKWSRDNGVKLCLCVCAKTETGRRKKFVDEKLPPESVDLSFSSGTLRVLHNKSFNIYELQI